MIVLLAAHFIDKPLAYPRFLGYLTYGELITPAPLFPFLLLGDQQILKTSILINCDCDCDRQQYKVFDPTNNQPNPDYNGGQSWRKEDYPL
jgi:hypothetical protein